MKRAEIEDLINSSLAEEFELDKNELHPDIKFAEDLSLDSLDYVDMVVALEQAFNFKLKDKEGLKKIRTLKDLHEYVIKIFEEQAIAK